MLLFFSILAFVALGCGYAHVARTACKAEISNRRGATITVASMLLSGMVVSSFPTDSLGLGLFITIGPAVLIFAALSFVFAKLPIDISLLFGVGFAIFHFVISLALAVLVAMLF